MYPCITNIECGWLSISSSSSNSKLPVSTWFFRYIRERDLDWAWWSLDGEQGPSRQLKGLETYGLLNTTWNGPAYPPLIDHLKSLG